MDRINLTNDRFVGKNEEPFFNDSSGEGMTIEDLTNYVSLSTNSIGERLRSCIDAGLLKRIRNSERRFVYSPTNRQIQIIDDSIIPKFTHDDFMKWYDEMYQGHTDRFELKFPKS